MEVVCEYALDQLESKGLVEVLELVGIADALRCPTDRAPKMGVTRSDVSRAAGPSACVVVSGRVIEEEKREQRKHVLLRVVCCEWWGHCFVWMIAGIAERETARKAIRRWREPRATVITLLHII